MIAVITDRHLAMIAEAAEQFCVGINRACELFDITTPLRQAHFIAQCAHESAGFRRLSENLNYSEDALLRVFPARVTPDQAKTLARNPEAIANHVYGGRMGNENPGDGWRYRGRGLIMLTGRSNYAEATRDIRVLFPDSPDFVADPDRAGSPEYAPIVAGWFWDTRNLNAKADMDDLLAVTKAINGGTHGLKDREQWLVKAKGVLL